MTGVQTCALPIYGGIKVKYYKGNGEGALVHRIAADIENERLVGKLFKRELKWWDSVKKAYIDNKERLGWLDILTRLEQKGTLQLIAGLIKEARSEGVEYVVNIGIGGSGNGAVSLKGLFEGVPETDNFFVLGSVEPTVIANLERSLSDAKGTVRIDKTLFIIISKSWTTVETDQLKNHFYNLADRKSVV